MKSLWRSIKRATTNSESKELVAENDVQDIGEAKCNGTSDQITGDSDSVSKKGAGKCHEDLEVKVNKFINKIDEEEFFSLDLKRVAKDLLMEDWNTYKQLTLEEVQISETENCPTINQLLQNYDKVYQWALETVLEGEVVEKQKKKIRNFILIAQELECNKDFHSSHAIFSALQSSSIQSLEKAWKKLSSNKRKMYKKLNVLFSDTNNYIKLTEKMDDVNICIPYLALFLKEFHEILPSEQGSRRVGFVVNDLERLNKIREEATSTTQVRLQLIHDGRKYRWV